MTSTACRCREDNLYRCLCYAPQTEYRRYGNGGIMLTTQSSSLRCLLNLGERPPKCRRLFNVKEESDTNFVVRTLKDFYEICTEYNLRYCPITGFVKHNGNYFRHIVVDVAILICFLVTNFIVFLTLLSKTIVHMLLVLEIAVQWILRMFLRNNVTTNEILYRSLNPSHRYQQIYPLCLSHK